MELLPLFLQGLLCGLLCFCCLLLPLPGCHRRSFGFEIQSGLAQLFMLIFSALELVREITAPFPLSVLADLLRVDDFCLAHQFLDLLLQLRPPL